MERIKSTVQNLTSSGNFLLIIGVIVIIPFVIISFFNHPSTDDYCFAMKSIQLGFWDAQINWYTTWTGRYFSSAILSFNPLVYKAFFVYKLVPIVLILMLFFSIYYFIGVTIEKIKKRDKYILTSFILIIFLSQMPNIPQGIYWMAGSITYQLANILTIFLVCFIIKLLQTNRIKFLILSVFLSFFVIGSNETSMLIVVFLVFIIVMFCYLKTRKVNYSLLILFTFSILFSVIVLKAPGNIVRGAHFSGQHEFSSLFKTVLSVKYFLVSRLPLILLFFIILFDHINRIEINSNSIFDINPFIPFLISGILLFIGFFPGYWSLGTLPPARTRNVIYLFFILSLFYSLLVLFFYLKKRKIEFLIISPFVRYLIFIMLLINLFHYSNVRVAYADLIKGKAYQYDQELKERYQIINNSKHFSEAIHVPELKNTPETLYFKDITSDTKHWVNNCYHRYWQAKSILIKNNK